MAVTDELWTAVDNGDRETVAAILEADPDAASARDENGISILFRALYRHRWSVAEAIAARRDDLDLFEAAGLGRVDRLQEILAADPDAVRSRSADGGTALHFAAYFGRPRAVEVLLAQGAEPGAVAASFGDVTPLHSAVAAGSVEVVAALLAAGSDPDARQRGGFTPLMGAAHAGREDLVQLLLAAGAEPSLVAEDGRTAEALAREGGHGRVLGRLEAALSSRPIR